MGADPVRVGSTDAFAVALALPPAAGGAGAGADPRGDAGGAADADAEAAAGAARPGHAVVDLTARSYDGLAAVRLAVGAGLRVLCVGQHDDRDLRRAALAAGAERVVAYRTLFENGHAVLAAWLGVPAPAAGSLSMPARTEVSAR